MVQRQYSSGMLPFLDVLELKNYDHFLLNDIRLCEYLRTKFKTKALTGKSHFTATWLHAFQNEKIQNEH